jgi:uncharacterized membrane protein YphA (DoxX/SURF4 family)
MEIMTGNIDAALKRKSRIKSIAYWATTIFIALENIVGAEWDLVKNDLVTKIFNELGYPLYVLTILGIWKILGGITLVVPKFPRLKEWAYAGIIFNYTGAIASHFFVGDAKAAISPFIFSVITVVSYILRPESRKL